MPHRRRFFSALASIFGLAALCFLAGAMFMFFQVPSSEYLTRALIGALAWHDRHQTPELPSEWPEKPVIRSVVDEPAETCDGFTLYACLGAKDTSTQAILINMRREVVHRWSVPFSRVWPSPPHLSARLPDVLFCFFACYLYPNGDLLAVFHGKTSPVGCGLVKLDKDSNVIWALPRTTHHDVDVGEDGTIYAIQQEWAYELASGLDRIVTPCEVDDLLVISPDGKLLREPISILSALADSPYAVLLEAVMRPTTRHTPPPGSTTPDIEYQFMVKDPLHTNSVKVLRRDQAAKFPQFKAGQVLISIRDLGVLAVIDPDSGKVVWAARGPWFAQHDAHFLDNGHLLLYDNLGVADGSRVLEYDPQTQKFPWSYGGPPDAPIYTSERGACQRLPNGNTFIVNTEGGEMIEVTPQKKVVWSALVGNYITTARRFAAEELPFLGKGPRDPHGGEQSQTAVRPATDGHSDGAAEGRHGGDGQ